LAYCIIKINNIMAWYKDPDRKIRADIPPISSTQVKILGTVGPVINMNDENFVQPKSIVSTTATIVISSGPAVALGAVPVVSKTKPTTTTTTPTVSSAPSPKLPDDLRPPTRQIPAPKATKSFSVPITAAGAKFVCVRYGVTTTSTITGLSTYDYNT
jgi:hypothetical protein